MLLGARLHHPRQEPGRNFGFKVVPSAAELPQRHAKIVIPPTSLDAATTVAVLIGTKVTTVPLIPLAVAKPCIDTVTLPLTSVTMVDTYFEAPPAVVISQPQLLTPGALVALW